MKRVLGYAVCAMFAVALCAGTVSAAKKTPAKAAAASAVETPSGIYEGINTEYDNYVIATYNFTAKAVKIATEKEDIDCVWKIDGNSLSLFYVVDGKPSTEVYETWIWDAAKKQYTMKDASGLTLKKKGK